MNNGTIFLQSAIQWDLLEAENATQGIFQYSTKNLPQSID
jgi:hypothetical protein